MRAIACCCLSILFSTGAVVAASLHPDAVEPGQAFTIAELAPPITARHIIAEASDGTTVELPFELSDSGRLVLFAPAHPSGLETGGTYTLRLPDPQPRALGSLTVLPIAPPRSDPGPELARLARRQASSLGWAPDALHEAFEREPGSLAPDAFLAAVLLEVVDGGEGSIRWLLDATEGTDAGHQLRTVFGDALISELDELAAGAIEPGVAALPPGAVLLPVAGAAGFASDRRRQFLKDAHPALWRDAGDELEITTAAELDYWMEKRAAIARHFDSPSLQDWRDDPKKSLESELDRRAADRLESKLGSLADDVAKQSPVVRAALLAKSAASSIFDLFMAPINFDLQKELAQLPSKLEPLSCSAPDSPHLEDDPRGGPSPMEVANWRASVVASNEPWTFTVNDFLSLMQSAEEMLTSLAGDLEAIATFGASDQEKDAFMKLLGQVDTARKKIQKRHAQVENLSGSGNDVFCATGVGCLEESATAWGPIDVSAADWVAAAILSGECVKVGAIAGSTDDGGLFTELSLDGSGSWSPPAGPVGYTVADTGTCTLRIMTRGDRFGGVHSEGTADVTVKEILVHVSAEPTTAREGEQVRLTATVDNAHDDSVGWPHNGSQDANTTWTAPELGPTECSREFRLEAESMSRQGIRHSGEPPRKGAITIRVVDPDNRLEVAPPSATTRTDESVRFRAASTGGTSTPGVTWQASGGSISADGTFTSSLPGTYEVMAMVPGTSVECAGTALVTSATSAKDRIGTGSPRRARSARPSTMDAPWSSASPPAWSDRRARPPAPACSPSPSPGTTSRSASWPRSKAVWTSAPTSSHRRAGWRRTRRSSRHGAASSPTPKPDPI